MQIRETRFNLRPGVFAVCFLCSALLVFVSYSIAADTHSEKMGKKSCIQCHKEITPDIVKEWKESAHGFTLTGCGVCHGDEKNFRIKPGNAVCMSCHSTEVEQNTLKSKNCNDCHPMHHFTQHKVKHYQKKYVKKKKKMKEEKQGGKK
ncbi:MAG: cytochrome C [bacterium]|nr:cytochrome C [bacterium]